MSFGTHVNKGKFPKMVDALVNYRILYPDADIAQIFAIGPRSSSVVLIKPDEYSLIKELQLTIYIHSCYLTHLWSEKKSLRSASRGILQKELKIADAINARGVVVHINNNVPPTEIVRLILKVGLENYNTPIYLENNFRQPYQESYTNLTKLKELFELINSYETLKGRIRYCLDTSHLWSSGFDVSNPSLLEEYLLAIKKYKPIIHLNDNKYPKGSLKDEHDSIGEGLIWKNSMSYKKVFDSGYDIIFERSKETFEIDFDLIMNY